MSKTALEQAVAAASKASGIAGAQSDSGTTEGTPPGEAPADDEKDTPDPTESTDDVDLTAEVEDEGDEPDGPDSIWGVDLSALDADERAKFVREFTETNKTIARLQRDNADLRKGDEVPTTQASDAVEEVDASALTDAEIAAALNIDLENSSEPERDNREIALARGFLELKQQVESLTGSIDSERSGTAWDRKVTALTSEFGELPEGVDLRKTGLEDPEAAYWAVMGPLRAQVTQELKQRLDSERKAGKKAASTPRPKTSSEVSEKLVSTDAKSATKEAFERAMSKLGVTLTES